MVHTSFIIKMFVHCKVALKWMATQTSVEITVSRSPARRACPAPETFGYPITTKPASR